jgi:hypothetical protein
VQTFFKKHIDQTLIAIALVLVVILAGFFAWSFTDLAAQINRIINFVPMAEQGTSFDLKGAATLDLKGLVGNNQGTSTNTTSNSTSSSQ